jgi:LDH2 family malate/lactate/ureidoglycolate dehydrogenase
LFSNGRNFNENIKAVIDDILGHGNENCMLPGQPEAQNAAHTAKAGGLLFSTAEVEALNEIADEVGAKRFEVAALGTYDVP